MLPALLCIALQAIEKAEAEQPSADMPARAFASVPIDPEVTSVLLSFNTGSEPAKVTCLFKENTPLVLNFKPSGSKLQIADLKNPSQPQVFSLDDQYIALSGLARGRTIDCYVRPNLMRYDKERQLAMLRNWGELPAASGHRLNVEFRLDPAGFEVWLEGRYCGRYDGPLPAGIEAQMGKGGDIKELTCRKGERNTRYLPLDVACIGSAVWREVRLPFAEGAREIEGVPMLVRGAEAGDVGAVRYVPARAPECDLYLARSPLDGMPETFHFSVPANQYAYAHLLCAVEDDPAEVPEVSARITRYLKNRGVSCDAIMDTAIRLPRAGEPVPSHVKPLGEVRYTRDGRELKAPLYLVSLPLKTGAITDLLFQPHDSPLMGKDPYLDFEIVGPVLKPRYASHALYPDNDALSSVQVLALTLERSPAELELKPEQIGNIFNNEELPVLVGELRGLTQADALLEWTVFDYDGVIVRSGKKKVRLEPGSKEAFRIPLVKLPLGWYSAQVWLRDGAKEWMCVPCTVAILGKDTRQALADSPYASRTASIMYPPTPEMHGILMQKAGIRGITPMGSSLDAGEKVYAQWKVRGYQIPWMSSRLTNEAEAEAEIENKIRKYLEKYPSAKTALILHESGGGPFPPELLDEPAPIPDAKTVARDQSLFNDTVRTCKVYREKFPDIRLQVGNSGNSLNLLAALMRMNLPKAYIDAMGEETLGQNKIPETPYYEYGNGTAVNFWFQKQLALKMGYGDLAVDACSEWKGRQSTDLGERTKAEWDMRDLLIAYAFGCKTIRTPDITDQGSMFYNTTYGSQGALRRYPLLYPKPSYVATATLTKVLDRVKLIRQVPLASNTTYILEFKRYGKEYVYAYWLPRGAAWLRFDFGRQITVRQVGMLGRETVMEAGKGKLSVRVSSGPAYLISPIPLKSVFRTDEIPDPMPAGYFVACAMDKASDWLVSPQSRYFKVKRSPNHFYGQKSGEFTLAEVDDEQKGRCLEWTLHASDADPTSCAGSIRLNAPLAVPGKPNTVGVWIKGNSSWARLEFELEDAEGEIFRSSGADWPANLSVNFDGWHLVRFPINNSAQWPHYIYPNWIDGNWGRSGKAGNKKVDYPIKLMAINVIMPRKVLNLTERKEVKNLSLRIKDLGVYSDATN